MVSHGDWLIPRIPQVHAPFSVRSEISGTQVTVFLAGRADAVGVGDLRTTLSRVAVRQPKRLVFDLSGLETLWSLVLGEMVGCARSVKRVGGTVEIAGATALVRNVLVTCRMDEVFEGLRAEESAPAKDDPSLN